MLEKVLNEREVGVHLGFGCSFIVVGATNNVVCNGADEATMFCTHEECTVFVDAPDITGDASVNICGEPACCRKRSRGSIVESHTDSTAEVCRDSVRCRRRGEAGAVGEEGISVHIPTKNHAPQEH